MNACIMKFGGTSMGNSQSIKQVAQIIKNNDKSTCVIVSAVSGITDLLLEMGRLALDGSSFSNQYQDFIQIHQDIIEELNLELNFEGYYQELETLLQGVSMLRELSIRKKDHLVSLGERMSSRLLSSHLRYLDINCERINAKKIIFSDNNYGEANVDFDKTNQAITRIITPLLRDNKTLVITGFIAISQENQISTLGRGGSDYTAAIIAAALDARDLQIWTDVDGIFQSDPRFIKAAKVLPQISFAEAGELAYFGAKVLHPKTIVPAIKKNIPVRILNTFNTEASGTLIDNEEDSSIKAITWKRNNQIIQICSTRMLECHGFLAKIFAAFAEHEIVIDVLATSEVSVSLTIDRGLPTKLIKKLNSFASVQLLRSYSIMCLVGSGISYEKGILGRLFSSLKDYQIDMVSQGASKRNITWLVGDEYAQEVGQLVFNEFFNN